MSLFGGGLRGVTPTVPQSVSEEKVELASNELNAITKLFNAIQSTCYSKCIAKKFYEGDLTTGEAVCLDRCVSKFFATHQKMNDVLMQLNNQNAQGQQ